MAVAGMIQDPTDTLEVLRALVSIKKEDVIAFQEENRRQIALTDAERTKAGEARTLIWQHQKVLDALKAENGIHESNQAELTGREEALKKAKKEHEANILQSVAQHAAEVDAFEEQKRQFALEIKAQEEKARKAQEGFQTQVSEFKKEKDRVAAREQAAKDAETAALAIKAKYEKKYADIIRQD